MKNLLRYLDKNNMNYEIEKFGARYFNNAPGLIFEGVIIEIDCRNRNQLEKITKYCNRYNYTIKNDRLIYPFRYLTVFRNQDNKELDLYHEFLDPCKNECELLIHRYHTEPLTINLNDEIHKTMIYWGLKYNTARKIEKIA